MGKITVDFRSEWKYPPISANNEVSETVVSIMNKGDIVVLGGKEFIIMDKKILFKENKIEKIIYNVKRFIRIE